jgi:glycosyltransferase involved in cell wall biosynthesis
MKILIINYYFEPFVGAHAYRWSQIAKVWAAAGHNVTVIAGRVDDVRCEVRDGVTVERIGFVRRQNNAKHSLNTISPGKLSRARLTTISLLKKVNRFFFWPDGLWHWLPFLLISLFKRRHAQYDLMISYSPTFSAHLGGLIYKRFNKFISRWVVDYGDPFSVSISMPPNNLKLYKFLNFYFERKVIEYANKVVFTNAKTLERYEDFFGMASCARATVIPHAVDISAFFQGERSVARQPFNLVYVGAFHRGIREPYFMVEFFNELSKRFDITVNVYGALNGVPPSALNVGCVRYHGVVSRQQAVEVIRGADILINIENSNCVMTPSKIVEYVATGLPIVNFYEKERTELLCHEGLKERVLHIKNLASLDAICKFIPKAVLASASLSEVKDILSVYELNNVAEAYLGGNCG